MQQQSDIELLITDQAMPNMSGTELIRRVTCDHPTLPIILATGYAELAPGEGKGIPRLSKPFSQQDLADAIARAVTPYSTAS